MKTKDTTKLDAHLARQAEMKAEAAARKAARKAAGLAKQATYLEGLKIGAATRKTARMAVHAANYGKKVAVAA